MIPLKYYSAIPSVIGQFAPRRGLDLALNAHVDKSVLIRFRWNGNISAGRVISRYIARSGMA